MTIDIAIGKNRRSAAWQNRQLSWRELVDRCNTTHRTHESYAEFLASTKQRQDEIKDVGAFVGGYLVNGSRLINSVMHRQVITLDADFASPDLWENFTAIFGLKAFMYSTHKHSPEKPRLRIVILADRPMSPDEYEPVCRRITGLLGIDQFDHTTYDVNRLMYWPSTARDGEFLFEESEGEPLNVDQSLAAYRNWRDSSEWPIGEAEQQKVKTGIAKQGNPTEKPGAIGLFCRTYTITDVLEKFLSDVYTDTSADDRYTYINGSTAGGLIVYDDLYTYSHHGTDPTGGRLSNAFDLVRVHKFGSLDEHSKPDTPVNKTPSFAAMSDFVMKDGEVRKLHMSERVHELQQDFGEARFDPDDLDWMGKLNITKRGEILATYDNVELIMKNDSHLRNRFRYNEFNGHIDVLHPMPWSDKKGAFPIEDDDERGLRTYLGKEPYNLNASKIVADLYPLIAKENSYHPIKEYLEALVWDGIPRVDTMLTDYLGASPTALNQAYIRKWLCAAVVRVYRPGAKFDNVLTLIGGEGTRKSTFFKSLGLSWFSDTFNFGMLSGGNGVRAYEQIRGRWVVEIPEMAGLRKAEVEAAKSFLSSSEDTYRVSHGKFDSTFPRQCVLGGTTNNRAPLIGQTGHRRYWTVDVDEVQRTKFIQGELIDKSEIAQVWAEVMTIYKTEKLALSAELEQQARAMQLIHTEADEREGLILRYLDMDLPVNWDDMDVVQRRQYFEFGHLSEPSSAPNVKRSRVCAAEIWVEALGGSQRDLNAHNTRFIHNMLRNLPEWEAYESKTIFKIYGNQRAYKRE